MVQDDGWRKSTRCLLDMLGKFVIKRSFNSDIPPGIFHPLSISSFLASCFALLLTRCICIAAEAQPAWLALSGENAGIFYQGSGRCLKCREGSQVRDPTVAFARCDHNGTLEVPQVKA